MLHTITGLLYTGPGALVVLLFTVGAYRHREERPEGLALFRLNLAALFWLGGSFSAQALLDLSEPPGVSAPIAEVWGYAGAILFGAALYDYTWVLGETEPIPRGRLGAIILLFIGIIAFGFVLYREPAPKVGALVSALLLPAAVLTRRLRIDYIVGKRRRGLYRIFFWIIVCSPGLYVPKVSVPEPAIISMTIVAVSYVISHYSLIDLRNLLMRIGYYLALFFLVALIVFGLQAYILKLKFNIYPPGFFIWLLTLFIMGGSLSVLFLHIRYLQTVMHFLFFRDAFKKERMLSGLITEIQVLEDSPEIQRALLELILQNLSRVFQFEMGFGIAITPGQKRILRYIGPPALAGIGEYNNRAGFRIPRIKLESEFSHQLNQIFLLESGYSGPFEDSPGLARRYPRLIKSVRENLVKFQERGFEVFIPLIFKDEFVGFILLGQKDNSEPYYNGELKLLENARLPISMVVRNNGIIGEIHKLRRKPGSAGESVSLEFASSYDEASGERLPHKVKLGNRSLVYSEPVMSELVDKTRQVAGIKLPVLIQGETGTGKELLARMIHKEGFAEDAPYVPVNCGAIPDELWESEVFGYMRGAFTDARRDYRGLVAQAENGVLFFDEVGEMPLAMQPKILRLIQEMSYRPLGGKKTLEAGCRLIFATHRDLEKMVAQGAFREDLYYRINVFQLRAPALRERSGDLPALIRYTLERYCLEYKKPLRKPTPTSLEAMCVYEWPGNIRELENCIIRLLAESHEPLIELEELPEPIRRAAVDKKIRRRTGVDEYGYSGDTSYKGEPSGAVFLPEQIRDQGLERLMGDYARELILFSLKECKGNQSGAARMLGISRGKLLYQMKELGIK